MIKVERFVAGVIRNNCYLIENVNKKVYALVDPGAMKVSVLIEELKKREAVNVKYILLTHGHFDHVLNVADLNAMIKSKIVIGKKEKDFLSNNELNLSKRMKRFEADIFVRDGDVLDFGDDQVNVIETPGHTIGSVCYIIGDKLFSGDTIFKGDVGRQDFPTGNKNAMLRTLRKIANLSGEYTIYPGHDETTTLSDEKEKGCLSRL